MKKYYIKNLPPDISDEQMLILYRKSNDINVLLRGLDVKMSHNIVNHEIITNFQIQEAIESTKIEGTQTTMHDILESRITKKDNQDIREVINYMLALRKGKLIIEEDGFIANRTIKAIHKALLRGDVRGANFTPGEFRKIDNWLGPDGSTRESASYIPPSHIQIADYMSNLEKFINEKDNIPVMIKCAMIHAQFESIHPFMDGNGRVGRMLIPLFFKLNEDETLSNMFISKQLETNKFKYYSLLNGTRKSDPEWFEWIDFFLNGIKESILEASNKYDKIMDLYNRFAEPEDFNYTKVYNSIFLNPITSISEIKKNTQLSRPTIKRVIDKLIEKKVVFSSDDIRNVRYYFYDLIDIL